MIGHMVSIIRVEGETIEGVLLRQDASGVIVYVDDAPKDCGLDDQKVFIPLQRILEIRDKGRIP